MHINIYGNCIIDSIYKSEAGKISFKEEKIGGIFNVARALPTRFIVNCFCCVNNADSNLNFGFNTLTQVSPKQTSKAKILTYDNFHTSEANFGACHDLQIFPLDGDWHHIAYLNELPMINPKQIKDLNGIKSGDLCGNGNFRSTDVCRIHALAEELDFLFMNDAEALSLFKNTQFKNIAKQATIIHSKDCIVTITPTSNKSSRFKAKLDFNSLGAGDRYVSRFIDLFLMSENIDGAAVVAHEE